MRKLPILILFFLFALPVRVLGYPNAEVLGTGSANPPFDFSVSSSYTGFLLTSDRRMVISYSEVLKLIDLGSYALESAQPPPLSSDDGTDGIIAAIAYDSAASKIYAAQEDGDVLVFDLTNITADPTSITVAQNDKLGPIVVDENSSNRIYVADNTAQSIQIVDVIAGTIQNTVKVSLPFVSSFTFTDAFYDDDTREIYFSTSAGAIIYFASGGSQYGTITIDTTGKKNIVALDDFPNGDYIYAVDATTPAVVRISTSTHAVITDSIDISNNPAPKNIVITNVTNPSATYAYVAGSATPGGGMSVINTSNDEVFDLGTDPDKTAEPIPISATPYKAAASTSSDGNIYMGLSNGKLGIVSANPLVTISSVTYSDGSQTLKLHNSFTLTFQSSQTGTYEVRSGGSVDATGTILTDSSGNTSGSVTAATDTSATFNYDDNSAALQEGANDIWVFVTSSPSRGRRQTTVTVDTPPPNVVMLSSGFGNERVYVTFQRLTASDMSTYRIYADTDPAQVAIKTEVAATVSQESSGSTQTGHVDGLVNGTLYYLAMEAVDANGNISPSRTTQFSDGSLATGTPEETVGPAGLLGEKGCGLVAASGGRNCRNILIVMFALMVILLARMRRILNVWRLLRPFGLAMTIVLIGILISSVSGAQEKTIVEEDVASVNYGKRESPQMWQLELKTGFWLPQNAVLKSFFGDCCNLITRIEGGLLLKRRYGVEAGVGFLYRNASARGVTSGAASEDSFNFILIPIETNFVWRADYFDWRYIIPFVRPGFDYVYFREGDRGSTTQGIKYGMHFGGGVAINIGEMADVSDILDSESGINDFFLTLEGRYQWINNFGGKGLDLSGGVYSIGLLFEF